MTQVSNWFINARVRLWKPMVEEMYMEEMKEQEQNGCHDDKSSKSSEDPSTKKGPAPAASETDAKSTLNSKQDVSCASNHNNNPTIASVISPSPSGAGGNVRNQFGFSFMGSSELEGITQASPKKPRNHDMMPPSPTSINMDVKPNEISNEQVSLKFGDDQRQGRDGYSFMENQTNFMGAFGQYPIGEIGRFDAAQHFAPRFSGNGVSLTLGLPHCDTLSGSHHQTFLPNHNNIQLGRRLEMGEANEFGGINPSTTPHSSAAAAFENINMQNPKRFVAQLLPDFVT